MKLIAVAAVDNNWAIGYKNSLLFKLPGDMAHFKKLTTGHFVICGYNTLLSFPKGKALPNRITICLTRKNITRDDCIIVHSVQECLDYLKTLDGDPSIYVIGGASIYKEFLDYYDEAIITKVDAMAKSADAYFPDLDSDPRFVEKFVTTKQLDGNYNTAYITYSRK